MSLSNDLISQFVKVTKDEKTVDNGTTVYGTTVIVDGVTYVRLDGSDQLTPVSTTTNVKEDERVTVLIKDHTATVTGNVSSPAARTAEVEEIGTKITEMEIVIADKVSTKQLEAQVARIDTLTSDNVTINKKLSAAEADISNLEAEVAKIDEIYVREAEVENLVATTVEAEIAEFDFVEADDLDAITADINALEATYITVKGELDAQKADIEKLEAGQLTVEQLEGEFANIDFANINQAAIENFFSKSGMIENLVVGEGTIAGELVGVTIKGDLIEGGTVKADKLVVKGSDGIYYKLNFEAGTFAAGEAVPTDSLHGSVITAKSITAEKITVKDLVAFEATIGGYHITDKALYSGAKASVDNTTRGVYMDSDGQMNVGDSLNFFKFYKDADGSYKLAISASSIVMSTTNKDIETAIEESVNRSYEKVGSRADQLITNGNGMLGDNTNFSQLTFDGAVSNNSPGSFTAPEGSRFNPVLTDEFIPLNPEKRYTMRCDVKSKKGLSNIYSLLAFYDVDKQIIYPYNYLYVPGTLTTLAKDLKKGDTVAYLTDVSAWQYVSPAKHVAIWNYTNSFGYTYPAETYTRNSPEIAHTNNIPNDGSIDYVNNTVTLRTAWTGDTIPAGTQVSQGKSGSTYIYMGLVGTVIPTTWTTYEGSKQGVGNINNDCFPTGSAYCKAGFLWNYNRANDQLWVTNITLMDTTADNDLSTRINNAETKITNTNTRIDQSNSKIALCATKTEVTTQISSAVNNIEVGGRNLVIGSTDSWTDASVGSYSVALRHASGGKTNEFTYHYSDYGIEVGDYITFAIDLNSINKRVAIRVDYSEGSGGTANYGNYIEVGTQGRSVLTLQAREDKPYFKVYIGSDGKTSATTTEQYKCFKVEKGNKATDWTPAPEDVDANMEANMDATNKAIEDAAANAVETSTKNTNDALGDYVKSSDFDTLKSETEGKFEVTDERITAGFTQVETRIVGVDGEFQTFQQTMGKYFDFSLDDGLIISTEKGYIRLRLDAGVIAFEKLVSTLDASGNPTTEWTPFGSWDGDYFHTGNIVVKTNERAQFGNFAFVPRKNGSLSLLKVGG